MKSFAIAGTPRTDLGTKFAKNVRREGLVPCVIYGGDEVKHFTAPTSAFKDLVYTPDFHVVEIDIDGKVTRCILKDIQFHPVTDEIQHVDFLQLVEGKTLKANIPIRFKGIAPGTKAGGKLIQKLRVVKVKTTPEKLVDQVFVDVSGVELGQSVKVKDIKLGEDMELLTSPGIPIASVEIPRALRSAQSSAAGTTEAQQVTVEE
jgi:large subunit ribosomal protein L25